MDAKQIAKNVRDCLRAVDYRPMLRQMLGSGGEFNQKWASKFKELAGGESGYLTGQQLKDLVADLHRDCEEGVEQGRSDLRDAVEILHEIKGLDVEELMGLFDTDKDGKLNWPSFSRFMRFTMS